MVNDDGSEVVTLADAEVRLIAQVLDGVSALARLRLAAESGAAETDIDDVPTPALRVVLDDAAGLLALGVQQPDGRVQQLAGYHLRAVRERLALLAEARLRDDDGGTPPQAWH